MASLTTIIYVIRHGESQNNVSDNIGGDPKLTEKGQLQARTVGEKLQNVYFDAFFSSDRLRTKQTAELVRLERKLAITTSEAIRERHYGILEGKLHYQLQGNLRELKRLVDELVYQKGEYYKKEHEIETTDEVIARFIIFLREIAVAYPGKTLAVVCHGNIMRTLLVHLGWAKNTEIPPHSIQNAGYIKLRSDGVDFFIEETHGVNKVDA